MTIDSQWDNPQHTVILTTHSRQWSWDELREHDLQQLPAMLDGISHPVAVISDMRNTHWVPQEHVAERVVETSNRRQRHPIAAMIFVLADSSVGTLLKETFKRSGSKDRQYFYAPTLEEARTLAAQTLNAYS